MNLIKILAINKNQKNVKLINSYLLQLIISKFTTTPLLHEILLNYWLRGMDSNPRYTQGVNRISSAIHLGASTLSKLGFKLWTIPNAWFDWFSI